MEIRAGRELHIALPLFATVVTITAPAAGRISTNLAIDIHDWMTSEQRIAAEEYNHKIKGIEAMVLASALADVDIHSPQYLDGYDLAVNSIYQTKEEILAMK